MKEVILITEVRSLFAVVQGTIATLNEVGAINAEGKRSLELACKFFAQEIQSVYDRQQPQIAREAR